MNRLTHLTALVAFASACALAASPARADDASSQAAAQALFDDARRLVAEGKYAEACPKLAESERLDPGAGTLMNLADCYAKNGQTASAWVTFKDAAATADQQHRTDWAARARQHATALEPKLSHLSIDIPAPNRADGMTVKRDGVEVGAAEWGVPIPSDPGEHAIEATAPHKKRWTGKVTVGTDGAQARIELPALDDEPQAVVPPVAPIPLTTPAAASPAEPTSSTAPARDGSSQRAFGVVVGGVGVIGVALGTVLGLHAISKNNEAKTLCPETACGNPDGIQANSDAKSAATIATVAMVAGAGAIGAGALLYFTAPHGEDRTGLRVTPQIGPGMAGIRLGGAW